MASYPNTHRISAGLRVVPLLLAALAMLSTLSLHTAHATNAQGAAFGIQPAEGTDPHLRFTIEPGQSTSAEVRILNRGDAPGTALSFVADAETLVGGGFGVASVAAPRNGATLWVDFPDDVTPLDAGEEHIRAVTVDVPADAAPGDYIIGMAVQDAPETAGDGSEAEVGVDLRIVNRQAMAIMVNVPGPRTPSLGIGGVSMQDSGSASTIAIDVLNDGNTHLTPAGKVQVSTLNGEELADVDVEFGRLYAGTSSAIYLPVDGFLPVGTYLVSTQMWDEAADVRAEVLEQELIVGPRELPNGEPAPMLDDDGPAIKAPASTTGDGTGAGSGSGSGSDGGSSLMMVGVGVGGGIAAAAIGGALLYFARRPRVVVARVVPTDSNALRQ